MPHSAITQDVRVALTSRVLDAKARKDLSWTTLADGTGLNVVYVTAALLGQHPLPPHAAELVAQRLGLGEHDVAMLQIVPLRGSIPGGIPTDPTIYRFYEFFKFIEPLSKNWCMTSWATASSAQSISNSISKRVDDPEGGSRAVITLDGKFLPYKPF